MDKMNGTRVSNDKNSKDSEFDFYLKSGLPSTQVVAMLKAQGKDQRDIDAFMEKYEVSRKKIAKVVRRFVEKIEGRFGHLDIPQLVEKGMKYATKHGFSPAERDAFVRFVMKGDVDTPYLPFQELGYTEMSKFLGFSNTTGQIISVKPTDQPALQEIAQLYEKSKLIHSGIRQNLVTYTSCDPNAIISTYNKEKDNLNLYVHPLIVALFLVRIKALERRMLYSNIGRMVVQRTQQYFLATDKKFAGWTLSLNDLIPGELESDAEFAYDIARDPNSLDHFNDETPMTNLLKRYSVQVELWKNVLAVRQGTYYSRSEGSFSGEDGIMGLHKVLSSYNWTYFDNPDMYHVHDEGTLLRKLLAVFSYRPTFTQISSFSQRSALGYSNLGAVTRATFVNTPICTIRLPTSLYGGSGDNQPSTRLTSALSQSGWFIENKMLVPKNTQVIHSRQMVFFYVNRRYQSPLANIDMGFRYMSVPGTMSAMTSINTAQIHIEHDLTIGQERFQLSSVVVLNPLLEGQLATGCSSIIVCPENLAIGRPRKSYYYYNPLGASIMYEDPLATGSNKFVRNDPISPMPENSNDKNRRGFRELARKYGTIFVYVNPNDDM
jgi:hypothetical protein